MTPAWQRLATWFAPPLRQGTLLLVLLITLFLNKSLFTGQILTATDILYEIDPLWQSLAPAGFSASQNGLLSDQITLFYPWQAYARQALSYGHFALWDPPLWNSFTNSGHPFVGNLQSALYDPLHLLSFLQPFPQSLALLAWLRLFVAGFFTLCLALELGFSRRAAYLAMVVFTFAMPQIVWLGFTKASVLAWLPALWFFSARLVRRGDWRDVVWLGLVTLAQLMGGHPEGSIYVEIAWGTFALYALWYRWRRQQQLPRLPAIQLGLAGLLGIGLSAVQWLPVLQTILQSTSLVARNRVVLDWKTLFFQWDEWVGGITLVLPNFFGNPRLDTYWYPLSYSNFNEQNFFMGVVPLALALLAIAAGRFVTVRHAATPSDFWQTPTLWSGPGAYFAWLGMIGIGLALSLPGFTLLAELPGLHLVAPMRWRGIVLMAVALLAGYGLDRYLGALNLDALKHQQLDRTLRRWAWILAILGVGSALGALTAWALLASNYERVLALGEAQVQVAVANPLNHRTYAEYMALASQRIDRLLASLHPTYWPTYLPLWLAILLLGGQRLFTQGKVAASRRNGVMGWLMLVIVLAELWRVAYDYNPVMARSDVFPTPPLITQLRQHALADGRTQSDPFRIVGINHVLSPNVNMVLGLEDVRGYEPSGSLRYYELMAQVDGAIPAHPFLLFRHAQSAVLDFLNVRYALSDVPLDAPWKMIAQDGAVTLYENPEVMPRAFLVYAVLPARTRGESLALTAASNFDPIQTVVLEVATDAEAQALTSMPPPTMPGRSTITYYEPGEIIVDVESDADSVLVLSESYLAGWHATVDGESTPLYVANHAFHALRVPAGKHTVEFTYAPISAVVGRWISLGCGVVLLALLILPRRRHLVDSLAP